jgi:D-glycero-D-manno-heptose 1,7-bisphosphate phosphatase
MRPALFLDRDGVVNVDHGYVHRVDEVEFVDGIFELVQLAHRNGFIVVIVTNQAGIGRGYYTEECFQALSRWMMDRFTEAGATIDAIYHCPHHPTEGLGANKLDCQCRKPRPGLILQAMADHSIAIPYSILIGDKPSDLVAGERAGIRHLFLLNDQQLSTQSLEVPNSAVAIRDLLDPALLHLLRTYPSSTFQP